MFYASCIKQPEPHNYYVVDVFLQDIQVVNMKCIVGSGHVIAPISSSSALLEYIVSTFRRQWFWGKQDYDCGMF